VREAFTREGLSDVEIDDSGNVLGHLPGDAEHRVAHSPLVVSAHLDTVFPAEIDLAVRRETGRVYGPGIGDNSLGVAALLGLVWRLREQGGALPGDVWLVANVGEEGLGNLRGMRAVKDRFGSLPKAYLVLEGMAFGHIYHRGIGVRRYRINARTTGGHSWTDFGAPSAVHELAALASRIAALRLPRNPRTTLNVGRIWGGTSVNTIAAQAGLELDMRCEDADGLQQLAARVDELVVAGNRDGVQVNSELIGERPPGSIDPDHPLIRLAAHCVTEQGVTPSLIAGSTDANVPLSSGYPALVLGLTTGGGAHTIGEYIDTAPLPNGLEALVTFVCRVWDV
jgi:acetylornithine deacetylase/succinyl-diaminopimelate desuccinylase-like protein